MFLETPPRHIARRWSIGDGAPVRERRRGSVAGDVTLTPHRRLQDAVKLGLWDTAAGLVRDGVITEPRSYTQALSTLFERYETSLRARKLSVQGVEQGDATSREAEMLRGRKERADYVRLIDLLFHEAARRGIDLVSFRYDEQYKWEASFPALMAYVAARVSTQVAPVVLSIDSEEQRNAFESARAALIQRLETLRVEILEEPDHEYGILWVEDYLKRVRASSLEEMGSFIESEQVSLPLEQGERRSFDKLKAALFNEPEGKEFCRLVYREISLQEGLWKQFYEMCTLKMCKEKRGHAIEAVLLIKSRECKRFRKALHIAVERGQWEWVRDILATGKISFLDSIGVRVRLFFYTLWQLFISLVQ